MFERSQIQKLTGRKLAVLFSEKKVSVGESYLQAEKVVEM